MSDPLEELKSWIGQKETDTDQVTIGGVKRVAATLDRSDPDPKTGDVLPLGWYSILFPKIVPHSQLGPDGHPRRGEFLPPVPLPRRMYGGKRVSFHAPLRIGDEVRREATIKDISLKEGRSGQMIFVTVKTDISSPRGLALSHEQDIIYRGAPDPHAPRPVSQPTEAFGRAVWKRVLTPDPVMVMRHSMMVFNSHRIHYDYRYVTQTEGYPDLVVSGGLTALFLFELAREHAPGPITFISYRNVKPLHVNRPLAICGEPSADGRTAKLWVVDDKEQLALRAEAALA